MSDTASTPDLEPVFQAVRENFGFVPRVLQEMAASPAALHAYRAGQEALAAHAALSPAEQQAVQLAVSAANGCHYCTAAHTTLGKAAGLEAADLEVIREGGLPSDPGLAAVVEATRLLMEKKGWLSAENLEALAGKGVGRQRLYDIIAFVGMKTITNWINHIANTPVDPELQAG